MTPSLILLLRGAFDFLFGLTLLVWMQVASLHGFAPGGIFAFVDGFLGIVLAATLLRSRARWLFLLALVDGVVRLLIGLFILSNPGMEHLLLGTAVFFTLMIVALVALGLAGVAYVVVGRPAGLSRREARAMSWPALTISVGAILLGVGLAFASAGEEKRLVMATYGILVGLALCVGGMRLRASTAST